MKKMKKIVLMCALMVTSLGASAQYDPGTWSMQVKFGFGASQVTNIENIPLHESNADTQFKGATMIAADFQYQATKWLGIQSGINFWRQGNSWENFVEDNVKFENNKLEMNYIAVPVLANFYVAKGLALKSGVQLGYLVNADVEMTAKAKIDNYKVTNITSVDVDDDCNKFDVSIPVGISYETKSDWIFGAQYNIGLTKVNKDSYEDAKDSKNGVFMFTVGWRFKL